jgi:hypothetical protein
MGKLSITLIGGPTALIEFCGFRLLTDPTFDRPGEYRLPHVTLKKKCRGRQKKCRGRRLHPIRLETSTLYYSAMTSMLTILTTLVEPTSVKLSECSLLLSAVNGSVVTP